ncbi:MAG: hypothetical protein ACPG19_02515 [Saprospiraceae bacterium]
MTFQSIANQMKTTPQRLFLIDGLGALLSAFLLGIVLVALKEMIGMPKNELYILSFLAVGFATYSLFFSWKTPSNWQIYLKIISIINLIYCCLTLGLVFYHQDTITVLGVVYFLVEILIVGSLAIFEFKVSSY